MAIAGPLYFLIAEILLLPLLKLFGATAELLPYARQYAGITLIGMPFLILTNGMSNLIRADGNPKYSMLCMVAGAIVNTILLAVIIGIAQGVQPIIGFNYGAEKYKRVREAYLLAIRWNLIVSAIGFCAFQFFPGSIISLFGKGEGLYFEFAILFMRTFLFMVVINGVQLISSNFFTAIGKAMKGLLLALTRQVFFLIPLILLLPLRFGLPGVLLAGPVADFAAFALSVFLVRRELNRQRLLCPLSERDAAGV